VSGLPSGSVTFLFTDIEGSTRLVKALRDRYAQVLAEHRRLIRAAIAAHAGCEVDTQGDSFFAAFGGAKQAVLCALQVQRGRTDAQIAAQLSVSIRTVSSHLDRIRDTTGCRNRADLTRLALQAGLV